MDLLQILASGVFIRGSSCLAFDAAVLTSSFGLFYIKVRNLPHSVLILKNSKIVFLAGFLKPMSFSG